MPTSRRREILTHLAAQPLTTGRLRIRLLRAAGVVFEGDAEVFSGLRIAGEGSLWIGKGTFINHDCLVDCAADVRIGRNVAFGNRVSLITSGHVLGGPEGRAGRRVRQGITVGDGAWLGANVTVLGGLGIGA